MVRAATWVSNTHGAGTGTASFRTERLYLHGTGKGGNPFATGLACSEDKTTISNIEMISMVNARWRQWIASGTAKTRPDQTDHKYPQCKKATGERK